MTLIGERLGNIRIVEKLGEGGMGEIYKGFDETLERHVAIKCIHAEKQLDLDARARFFREAKVLSKFEHSNICRVYDLIQLNDSYFLVMELVQGSTLTKVCERGVDSKTKLDFALQITTGLAAAHEKNIVHRDLKPDNIMVTPQNRIKILDFGMAHSLIDQDMATEEFTADLSESDVYKEFKALQDARENLDDERGFYSKNGSVPVSDSDHFRTQVGRISGTPMFMSPEQANGESGVHSCDMYSLGLIFQWMFTGKSPYLSKNPIELLFKAIHADTMPVQGQNPEITTLINRLKSLSPASRPTAQDVIKELMWILEKPKRVAKRRTIVGIIVILMMGTFFSTWGFFRARQSEKEATMAREETEVVNQFLQDMLASPDPSIAGKDVRVIDVLDNAAEKVDASFQGQKGNLSAIHTTLGWTYKGLGDYKKAHAHLLKAMALSKEAHGLKHTRTFSAMSQLAVLSAMMGQSVEAEKLMREVLSASESILPEDDEQILKVKGNLGLVLRNLGQYKEAEALFRQNLIIQKRVFGEESRSVLYTMNNLAIVLSRQENYEEAESFFFKSYKSKEKLLGVNHPSTIQSLDNLAMVYDFRGKLQEAEGIYTKTLAVRKEILGDEHPKTRNTLHNLGALFLKQHKYTEALQLFQENYEIQLRLLGNNHPDTVHSKSGIAKANYRLKKYKKAEELYREILESLRETLGKEHPRMVIQMLGFGLTLTAQEKHTQAEGIYADALVLAKKTLGKENSSTIILLKLRANGLVKLGDLIEAEKLYRELIETQTEQLGKDHPKTIANSGKLARVLEMKGMYAEAETLFRRLILSSKEVNGENHGDTLDLKYGRGLSLMGLRRYEDAAIVFKQILPHIKNDPEQEHVQEIEVVDKLQLILKLLGG